MRPRLERELSWAFVIWMTCVLVYAYDEDEVKESIREERVAVGSFSGTGILRDDI